MKDASWNAVVEASRGVLLVVTDQVEVGQMLLAPTRMPRSGEFHLAIDEDRIDAHFKGAVLITGESGGRSNSSYALLRSALEEERLYGFAIELSCGEVVCTFVYSTKNGVATLQEIFPHALPMASLEE